MTDRIQAWLAQHFKSADDVGTAFAVAMFVCAGLGSVLNLDRLVSLGVAFFGAAIVAWGVNALQTRELRIFQHGIRISERFQEIFVRVWGLLFVGFGILILGYGTLTALNPRAPIPSSAQQFFASPLGASVLMFVGSAIGMLFALALIFISDAQGSNAFVRFILSLPARLFGILLFVICAALAVIALLQIFAPNVLMELSHAFLQRMGLE